MEVYAFGWSSGLVTEHNQLSEQTVVSHLMDQIANRVTGELRKPHAASPQ